ncbi:MAG: ImpA family metalloprotease [Pseudomonas sp.]
MLDAALVSGDASLLVDSKLVAERLQQETRKSLALRQRVLQDIYSGVSAAYSPGQGSQWILPASLDNSFPLLVGEKGNVLAAISVQSGGRAVAYGSDILNTVSGSMAEHAPMLKRVVQWLVTGSADGQVAANFKVSVVGASATQTLNGLRAAGLVPSNAACNALAEATCVSDLLVVNNDAGKTTPAIAERVKERMQAGLPILYVNNGSWGQSTRAQQLLESLGFQQGPYAGNYWANDLVSAARASEESVRLAANYMLNSDLLDTIVNGNWRSDYDWSKCVTDEAGKISCHKVPGIAELTKQVDEVKQGFDAYNRQSKNLFKAPETTLLRLWSLWGDSVRQTISYPLDKVATYARFQEAFVADATVSYVREIGVAQKDLGSYATARQASMPVSPTEETLTITLPQASGFTAIGRMAVPGKTLSIVAEGAGAATLAVALNTQRPDSTRLWHPHLYNRPRFLQSPEMALVPETKLSLVSPYGGLLQLAYSGATPGQKVTIKVTGAASQPFLDMQAGEDNSQAIASFIEALNGNTADWMELRSGTVEVHSKVSKMRDSIAYNYGGDLARLLREAEDLFINGAYILAGFAVPNMSLPASVTQACQALGWDCSDETLHRMPNTQHINVDDYAQCGGGCSGNPYDQTWGLDPRGWGESHELGHNLQVSRLSVYGGRSQEVSNQIFALQKNWRKFRELGVNSGDSRTNYRAAYNLIVAGRAEADPLQGVYKRIWEPAGIYDKNGERMAFYSQWAHYWSDLKADPAQAWDIWTLLYLHQRLVDKADWASNKDRLGYGTYASRPGGDGNDNLLVALSFLTQRDQRPTFALWGISTSAAAQAQVAAYGFEVQPAFFYANKGTNNHSTAIRLDMSEGSPAWPFP